MFFLLLGLQLAAVPSLGILNHFYAVFGSWNDARSELAWVGIRILAVLGLWLPPFRSPYPLIKSIA
jgi:hypothetical protein